MTRYCAAALAAALLALAVASAAWADEVTAKFDQDGVVGQSSGSSYQPGSDWTIAKGLCSLDAENGLARLGYSGESGVGPGPAGNSILVTNQVLGKGTYSAKYTTYRPRMLLAYQDPDNYYFAQCLTTHYEGVGNASLVFGVCEKGKIKIVAGAGDQVPEAEDDHIDLTVQFDPAAENIKIEAKWTDKDGKEKYAGKLEAANPKLWAAGKMGHMTYLSGQLLNITANSFKGEPGTTQPTSKAASGPASAPASGPSKGPATAPAKSARATTRPAAEG